VSAERPMSVSKRRAVEDARLASIRVRVRVWVRVRGRVGRLAGIKEACGGMCSGDTHPWIYMLDCRGKDLWNEDAQLLRCILDPICIPELKIT